MPRPLTPVPLHKPGLFVTGTDTGVGKTLVTCAIAAALRKQAPGSIRRVGVMKPFATGCRRDREGLINEDAEALAYFADSRQPLDVINPVRFVPPLAPAVAAEQAGVATDWPEVWRSLATIDAESDAVVIEGAGGALVPLDPADPKLTITTFAAAVGYPVVVVARSLLGTLNHTAMTVQVLKAAGLRVAGVVMNGYDADPALQADPSVATNREWIEKMTGVKVIATVPRVPDKDAQPGKARIGDDVLEAVAMTYWPDVLAPAQEA